MNYLDMDFVQLVRKKTSEEFEFEVPGKREYYSHPTFVVNSLSEYIKLVTIISKVPIIDDDPLYSQTVIYRGMTKKEYNLQPGLARGDVSTTDVEQEMINDFLTRRPEAFHGLSDFDCMAKMQHYGLPTRLLDFSTNPLVALYFACESNFTSDGRVVCHDTFLENDSSPYIGAVCTAAIRKMFDENYKVEEYVCNEQLTLRQYLTQTYYYGSPLVVRPKYWNERIANQAGVFMLFPNNIVDRYMSILIFEEKLGLEKSIYEFGHGEIDIDAVNLALIKEPLKTYRREKSSLVTDKTFRRLCNAYSKGTGGDESYWERFHHRFKMSDSIKEISKESICKDFCSIIVLAKAKKSILKDLSIIGFGEDFVFPELEYTAKEIKRRYLGN